MEAAQVDAGAGTTVFEQPCTFKGIQSALAAGAFGYLLGFVPAAFRFKFKAWGMINKEGWKSAQTIAIMSGLYATVSCITSRIRQKEDKLTRGIAGCATGLALGWQGGPFSALQSCAGIGALSYIFDFGPTSEGEAKAAACRSCAPLNCMTAGKIIGNRSSTSSNRKALKLQGRLTQQSRHLAVRDTLQLPAVMWLATVSNSSYFS